MAEETIYQIRQRKEAKLLRAEARLDKRAALDAAARLYVGANFDPRGDVTRAADTFFTWLQQGAD